jgi:pimeloyl-ACP methyl ester carboxylesterase
VLALAHFMPEQFTLVGHSLGAAVAATAALRLGDRVTNLILFEPILFYLLQRHGETEAFHEIDTLGRGFTALGTKAEWDAAARLFIDYWGNHGARDAMDDSRRERVLQVLPPLLHEWPMTTTGGPSIDEFAALTPPVHFIHAADTRLSARGIAELLQREIPRWHFHQVAAGGHIAPITRPDLVNPLIARILDGNA